ncbi:MAG: class I SAM-dependent methyltransferase, partial [Actinomycetota bacterium]|nr:class I SAM-dependent methyltransferase [Actinomycetota bacterium]
FDPVTARGVTERIVVRGGRVRRFQFFVRMFLPPELRDWLLDAGFLDVEFHDGTGERLTASGRRMITVARL